MRIHTALRQRLLLFASALAITCSNCTVIGYSMGFQKDNANLGTEVELGRAGEIEAGMPLRVELADSTLRGVHLGLAELPTSGKALRLGRGNAAVLDRLFREHVGLTEPTTADVPDTLFVPLDRIRSLKVATGTRNGVKYAAAGAGVDLAVVVIVSVVALASAGWLAR